MILKSNKMKKIIFNKGKLLISLVLLGVIFTFSKCEKDPVNPPDPPDPPASTLKINSFGIKSGSVTKTGATFDFATSSNKTITVQSLIDSVNGIVYEVLGKTSFQVNNLTSSKDFPFTLYAKDASGKEVKESIMVHTLDQASAWLSLGTIVYANPFAIVGGAQSWKIIIPLENTSSATKTLKSLKADFGPNGQAVKMLRYKTDTSRWIKSMATGSTGQVTLRDLALSPGVNNIEAYFSLKSEVGGVANGQPLTLSFVSLDDGEGAGLPSNGAFPAGVNVGSVDAVTPATEIVLNYPFTVLTLLGGISRSPHSGNSQTSIFSFYFKLKGPSQVRLHSIKLKNPYVSFPGLAYTLWVFDDNRLSSPYENINNVVWENGQEFVTLTFPDLEYNKVSSDGQRAYRANIRVSLENTTNLEFASENYTPGEHGFQLNSKYDIVILNSSGQVVDLSDVSISKQYKGIILTD